MKWKLADYVCPERYLHSDSEFNNIFAHSEHDKRNDPWSNYSKAFVECGQDVGIQG